MKRQKRDIEILKKFFPSYRLAIINKIYNFTSKVYEILFSKNLSINNKINALKKEIKKDPNNYNILFSFHNIDLRICHFFIINYDELFKIFIKKSSVIDIILLDFLCDKDKIKCLNIVELPDIIIDFAIRKCIINNSSLEMILWFINKKEKKDHNILKYIIPLKKEIDDTIRFFLNDEKYDPNSALDIVLKTGTHEDLKKILKHRLFKPEQHKCFTSDKKKIELLQKYDVLINKKVMK